MAAGTAAGGTAGTTRASRSQRTRGNGRPRSQGGRRRGGGFGERQAAWRRRGSSSRRERCDSVCAGPAAGRVPVCAAGLHGALWAREGVQARSARRVICLHLVMRARAHSCTLGAAGWCWMGARAWPRARPLWSLRRPRPRSRPRTPAPKRGAGTCGVRLMAGGSACPSGAQPGRHPARTPVVTLRGARCAGKGPPPPWPWAAALWRSTWRSARTRRAAWRPARLPPRAAATTATCTWCALERDRQAVARSPRRRRRARARLRCAAGQGGRDRGGVGGLGGDVGRGPHQAPARGGGAALQAEEPQLLRVAHAPLPPQPALHAGREAAEAAAGRGGAPAPSALRPRPRRCSRAAQMPNPLLCAGPSVHSALGACR